VEDENRSQDNLPYMLSSAIEEERAAGRTCFGELQRQREKLTIGLPTPWQKTAANRRAIMTTMSTVEREYESKNHLPYAPSSSTKLDEEGERAV
jgi:hypothetical protein